MEERVWIYEAEIAGFPHSQVGGQFVLLLLETWRREKSGSETQAWPEEINSLYWDHPIPPPLGTKHSQATAQTLKQKFLLWRNKCREDFSYLILWATYLVFFQKFSYFMTWQESVCTACNQRTLTNVLLEWQFDSLFKKKKKKFTEIPFIYHKVYHLKSTIQQLLVHTRGCATITII